MDYDKTVLYWISPAVNTQAKFTRLLSMLAPIKDDDSEDEKKKKQNVCYFMAGYIATRRKYIKIEEKLEHAGDREDGDLVFISTKCGSENIRTGLSGCTKYTRLYILGHGSEDKIEGMDAVALVKHLREHGLRAAKRVIIFACGYDGSHARLASQTCQLLGLGREMGSRYFNIPIDKYNWDPIKCEVAGFDSAVSVNAGGGTIVRKVDERVELRVDVNTKKRKSGGSTPRRYYKQTKRNNLLAKTVYKWEGDMVVTAMQMYV